MYSRRSRRRSCVYRVHILNWQVVGTRDFLDEISKSALFSQSVWVAEEMRIIAKQVDGAEALEELGVDP